MKTRFLAFLFIITFTLSCFAQSSAQMEFQNDFHKSSGDLGNLTTMYMSNGWWTDANGEDAAVIRIKIQNMSVSDMKKLDVIGSPNLALGKKEFYEQEQQWLLAVNAGKGMYLELVHPTYGTSTRLTISDKLDPKSIYDVTLINNRTTSIVVTSLPSGADVYLDGDRKGKTPLEIPSQRLGAHNLRLIYNGVAQERDIYVEEGNSVFDDFDFRERATVDILSDPDGADIYMDGIRLGKAPILGNKIIVGPHTFIANLNDAQKDTMTIDVTNETSFITLRPIKKGIVNITTKYSGRLVSANLYVDEMDRFSGKSEYNIRVPYGKHSFQVSYGGRTKKKTINVNKPYISQEFKLSAKNDMVWPWQREYTQRAYGFAMGYVQKQIVSKNGSERYNIDGAYGREGKSLSGMQMGIHFQPTLSWGGGFYTGLFWEMYMASSEDFGENYKYFTEHCLNIPAHLYYRLPFSDSFSIAVHGGLGFDFGLSAKYRNEFVSSNTTTSTSSSDYYGEDNGGPKSVNVTGDITITINIKHVAINAFMSKGILDNKGVVTWDQGEYKTVVNKLGISVSYLW